MTATFGKLQQSELQLQPGLNIIYAPNESGKSTWTAFLRTMLYGLSTRERGTLADKNRYAPWNGSAMHGRLDVIVGGDHYTVTRHTKRANAPMGDFSCTYRDTAIAVPSITAQNLGETLLGVPREVFERSALIRQSALAVDQDAELERRIAALITTGEEDTSYTEAYDRLKKQLNRRRHNKSGLIPALEQEMEALDASLEELGNLSAKSDATRARLSDLQQQLQTLQTQNEQWEQLSKQEAALKYRIARQQSAEAQQRSDLLMQMNHDLPDPTVLTQLEGQSAALSSAKLRLSQAKQNCEAAQAEQRRTQNDYERHPLYPADESELMRRQNAMTSAKLPGKAWWGFTAIAGIAAVVLALLFAGVLPCVLWGIIASAVIFCGGTAGTLYYALRKRKVLQQISCIDAQKAVLTAQIGEYLPLQRAAADKTAHLAQAQSVYNELSTQYQQDLSALLTQVQRFQDAASDLPSVQMALQDARHKQQMQQQAQRAAQDAALRCQMIAEHLPSGALPDPDTVLPQPETSREQIEELMRQTTAEIQAARTQLDTLQGQMQALGNPTHIAQQRQIKSEQLSQLQAEYDALQLAMASLETANLTLQNRFSPALGKRAAEIFSAMTAGRYHKVLLSRDFSLSAEAENDPIERSIQLLSQGTADQLYLAVRLAICDMVLPEEKAVPLILDDALLTFDDSRLQAALDYLVRESEKRQIILFSCQKREQSYLAGRDGVHMLTL
ncbi:MAG: AAA family ATPase [Eubacteriales bacterium]|nr:AAA family ATPase [Eubacteriales bacterium]